MVYGECSLHVEYTVHSCMSSHTCAHVMGRLRVTHDALVRTETCLRSGIWQTPAHVAEPAQALVYLQRSVAWLHQPISCTS